MKKIILLLHILAFSIFTYAQAPVTELWHVYNDGAMIGVDKANALVLDPSGNIYITGITIETTEKGQFTTIKYDSLGNELWQSDFTGSATNKANKGNKIIRDINGNIYAVGVISDKGGDIGILKYNDDSLVWAEGFTPSWFGSYYDEGLDIGSDNEGNVYAIGKVTSTSGSFDDVYTIKVNADGNMIWENQFSENSATDYPSAIAVSGNGNAYSLTTSFNFWGSVNDDLTTIHYDSDGIEQWISRYNGEGNGMDWSTDIVVDSLENQYVCGSTLTDNGDQDYVTMFQNEFGTMLWADIYEGSAGENDTAFAVNYLSDGKVIVTGVSYETIGGESVETATTILLDSDGSPVFTKNYSGDENFGAAGKAIAVDMNDGIYVAGYVNTVAGQKDGLIIKYDTLGEVVWLEIFDSEEHLWDQFNDIKLDQDFNVVVTGNSFSSGTNARYLTVKYAQEMEDDTTGSGTVDTNQVTIADILTDQLILYPNPAKDFAIIESSIPFNETAVIRLFDISGKESEIIYSVVGGSVHMDLSALTTGIYIIKIEQENRFYTGKLHKPE